MKLVIAGGRDIDEEKAYGIIVSLRHGPIGEALEIVSGGAKGVDKAGELYAQFYDIPCRKFPADWTKYGRPAGPMRNKQMAEYADALLLIWNGISKGSGNMRLEMSKLNKKIIEVIV